MAELQEVALSFSFSDLCKRRLRSCLLLCILLEMLDKPSKPEVTVVENLWLMNNSSSDLCESLKEPVSSCSLNDARFSAALSEESHFEALNDVYPPLTPVLQVTTPSVAAAFPRFVPLRQNGARRHRAPDVTMKPWKPDPTVYTSPRVQQLAAEYFKANVVERKEGRAVKCPSVAVPRNPGEGAAREEETQGATTKEAPALSALDQDHHLRVGGIERSDTRDFKVA